MTFHLHPYAVLLCSSWFSPVGLLVRSGDDPRNLFILFQKFSPIHVRGRDTRRWMVGGMGRANEWTWGESEIFDWVDIWSLISAPGRGSIGWAYAFSRCFLYTRRNGKRIEGTEEKKTRCRASSER